MNGYHDDDEQQDRQRRAGDVRQVKLNAESSIERVSAVRAARPDAEIIIDVNQGCTFGQLTDLAPKLGELGVAMIEQPLPVGGDEALEVPRATSSSMPVPT